MKNSMKNTKGMMIFFALLLAIPMIPLEAAKKKKQPKMVYAAEVVFTDADLKQIKGKDAKAIVAVLTDAQKIDEVHEKLAKLQDLGTVATKSEIVNKQVLSDLAIVLGVLRGYTKYDESFKTAQQNLKKALDELVTRVEAVKVSKNVKKAFAEVRDAINAAVVKKAEALSAGGKIAKQKSVPNKDEVQGFFATVFVEKAVGPEKATETKKAKSSKKTHKRVKTS